MEKAEGIVVRVEGRKSLVRVEGRDRPAMLRGLLKAGPRRATHPIATGDRVLLDEGARDALVIDRVLERRNLLARKDPGDPRRCHALAANVDQLICVQSFRDPPLNLRALDRYLLLARAAGIPAIAALNKLDLHAGELPGEIRHLAAIGVPVLPMSARTGQGVPALEALLKGRLSVLAGPSGVGKSSLLNALVPRLRLRTRPVSHATSRGVHTTARVEWCDLPGGGAVLDTPGLRSIQPWGIDASNLASAYPEFEGPASACRFPDCRHRGEPDCAVRVAAQQGQVPGFRYDSYLRILASLEEERREGQERGGGGSR